MLSHSLQQQVVDGGEVIVAAALQRLMRTEQSHDFAFFTVPSLLHSVPISGFYYRVWNMVQFKWKSSLTERQTSVQAPQLSFGGRSPVCS